MNQDHSGLARQGILRDSQIAPKQRLALLPVNLSGMDHGHQPHLLPKPTGYGRPFLFLGADSGGRERGDVGRILRNGTFFSPAFPKGVNTLFHFHALCLAKIPIPPQNLFKDSRRPGSPVCIFGVVALIPGGPQCHGTVAFLWICGWKSSSKSQK
jgi:hypothetical protein